MAQAPHPSALGLYPAFEMIAAPAGQTFFYRKKHKRVIEARVVDDARLHRVRGPLVYAVADREGRTRYLGKWVSETPLYARWFRHATIHHHEQSRAHYLAELEAGRAPLTVWSASVAELRRLLPASVPSCDKQLAEALEGLWVPRWRSALDWNYQTPRALAGFTDGEYWRSTTASMPTP